VRIAIPQWNGRVSPVLDVAKTIVLFEIFEGEARHREIVSIEMGDLIKKARWFRSLGIETLICGALSRSLERTLTSTGIEVIPFICGDVENVVEAYAIGQLNMSVFQMPGYTKRRKRKGE
jgi:predicted Fe-Mo cluster-binding NifX family protein